MESVSLSISNGTSCKFCLKNIYDGVIAPCDCTMINLRHDTTNIEYCHKYCLTEYRIQCYNNKEFIQCGRCEKKYEITKLNLGIIKSFYYYMRMSYIVRMLYYLIGLALYSIILILPIFGIVVIYLYIIYKDAKINSGMVIICILLASATWLIITYLCWLIFVSNYCCKAICVPARYSRGFIKYHKGYYLNYGPPDDCWYKEPLSMFWFMPDHEEDQSICDYIINILCPDADAFTMCAGLIIIVPTSFAMITIFYPLILFWICIQLVNNRYKRYVKSTISMKYKISENDLEVISEIPGDYNCGFTGTI